MENALTIDTLLEIEALLKRGVLPVNNAHLDHLSQEGNILGDLLSMKREGLICGAVVEIGEIPRPYRMTNIRLTYLGIRMLQVASPGSAIAVEALEGNAPGRFARILAFCLVLVNRGMNRPGGNTVFAWRKL